MPEKAKKTLTFTPTGDEGPVEKTPNAQGGYTLKEPELKAHDKDLSKPKVGPYVVDTPEEGEPEVPPTNSKAMRQDMMTNPEAYGVKVGNNAMPGVGNITPEREQKWANSMKAEKDYGADWTKGFNKNTLRDSKLSIGEAFKSYEKYLQDHPEAQALNPYDYFAYRNMDLNKSLSDNEKDEAKAKNDEKWENIQNALFSFADLYSAAKGAPTPENAETPEQLTKRQEERRDKVKAMRDKDWQTYMALYQKQQADDLARANAKLKAQAQENDKAYKAAKLIIEQNKAKMDENKAKDQHNVSVNKIENENKRTDAYVKKSETEGKASMIRANKAGNKSNKTKDKNKGEETVEWTDEKGVKHTKKTPLGSSGTAGQHKSAFGKR